MEKSEPAKSDKKRRKRNFPARGNHQRLKLKQKMRNQQPSSPAHPTKRKKKEVQKKKKHRRNQDKKKREKNIRKPPNQKPQKLERNAPLKE